MSTDNPQPPTSPSGGDFTAKPPAPFTTGGPLSAENLVTLNEEIAGMARAGLPLDQGLAALAREMSSGRLQQVTQQLADDLRAGHTLPQAIERQKDRVPNYYAALLAAGIRTGKIGEVLATLTLYARAMAEFRGNALSATLYPSVVLLISFGIFAFMGILIVPKFEQIFMDFKIKLPLITEALILVSRYMVNGILFVPIVVVVVSLVSVRFWLRSSAWGRGVWARIVYALPLVGTLIRSARLAAFTDLLGILVDQSIPLPEAWRLAAEASSDPLLNEGAGKVETELRQGQALGAVLRQQRLVPELIVWMVQFGERQGTLGPTLHHVAEFYRRQMGNRATLIRILLPPLLIIILAGSIGALFIFGMIAPLVALLDALSGGGK